MKTVVAILTLITFTFLSSGVEGSAKECYKCIITCADPVDKQTCADMGEDQNYKCWRDYHNDGNGQEIDNRMCMPDVPVTTESCDAVNQIDKGSCTLCDTDLCNTAKPDDKPNPGGSSAEMHSVSAILLLTLFFILYRTL